jgi:hypothetical protein
LCDTRGKGIQAQHKMQPRNIFHHFYFIMLNVAEILLKEMIKIHCAFNAIVVRESLRIYLAYLMATLCIVLER